MKKTAVTSSFQAIRLIFYYGIPELGGDSQLSSSEFQGWHQLQSELEARL